MSWACSTKRAKGNANWTLVEKPKGKNPLGRHSYKQGIKLKCYVNRLRRYRWIDLAKDGDK